MNFFSASCTDVGKRRKLNEDSILDRPDLGIWVVADGMGGHEAGEVASAMIVDRLGQLPPGNTAGQTADLAGTVLEETNDDLVELAHADGTRRTIGSTVVALAIAGSRFACIWAGDSRAYLVRDKVISQLSTDHSLVNDLVRSGLLAAEDAAKHPDANVITRAVGAAAELKLDRVDGDAGPGDYFLLVSDGVSRVMQDDELRTIVLSYNPRQATDRIRELVLDRGAPDNLSVIIIRVH
jgi:serine/threonine protein phosphatase Stp1